jgi:hypothetical protein
MQHGIMMTAIIITIVMIVIMMKEKMMTMVKILKKQRITSKEKMEIRY